MSETEAEKLLAKIASQPKKKAADRLRDMFDALEAALAAKTRKEVFEELKPINLGITFKTFNVTIERIRKERGTIKSKKMALDKETKTTPAAQAPAPAPTPTTKTATTQQLVENKSGVFEPATETSQPENPKSPQKQEDGIVDIFTKQAEREEEKKRNPPKRTIRRLT